MQKAVIALTFLCALPTILTAAEVGLDPARAVRGDRSGKYSDNYFEDIESTIAAIGGEHIPAIDVLKDKPQSELCSLHQRHAANPKYVARLLWCKNFRLGTAPYCVSPDEIIATTTNQAALLLLWKRLLLDDEVLGDAGRKLSEFDRIALFGRFLANEHLSTRSIIVNDNQRRNIFHALMTTIGSLSDPAEAAIFAAFATHRRLPSITQFAYLGPTAPFAGGVERTVQSSVLFLNPFTGTALAILERRGTRFLKFIFSQAAGMIEYGGRQAQDYLLVAALARADQEVLERIVTAPFFDIAHFLAHPEYWSVALSRGPGDVKRFFSQLGKGFGMGLFGVLVSTVRPDLVIDVSAHNDATAGSVTDTSSLDIANIRSLRIGHLHTHDGTPLYHHIAAQSNHELNHNLWDRLWFERNIPALQDLLTEPGFAHCMIDHKTAAQAAAAPATRSPMQGVLKKLSKSKYRPGKDLHAFRIDVLRTLHDAGVRLTFNHIRDIERERLRNEVLAIWTPRLLATGAANQRQFLQHALVHHNNPVFLTDLFSSPHFQPTTPLADGTVPLEWLLRNAETEDQALTVIQTMITNQPGHSLIDFRNADGYGLRHIAQERGWNRLYHALHGESLEDRYPDMQPAIAAIRAKLTALNSSAPLVSNLLLIEKVPGMNIANMVNELSQEMLKRNVIAIPTATGAVPEGIGRTTPQTLRDLFNTARDLRKTCIVFIDDLEKEVPRADTVPAGKHLLLEDKANVCRRDYERLAERRRDGHEVPAHKVLFVATTQDSAKLHTDIALRLAPRAVTLGRPATPIRRRAAGRVLRETTRHRIEPNDLALFARRTRHLTTEQIAGIIGAARPAVGAPLDMPSLCAELNSYYQTQANELLAPVAGLQHHAPRIGLHAGQFGSLGGCDAETLELLLRVKAFLNGDGPSLGSNSILLHGPAGVGKTALVDELIKCVDCRCIKVDANLFSTQADAGHILYNAFKLAGKAGPALIVLDEVDEIAKRHDRLRPILKSCLNESRGENVIVIGTTNFPLNMEDSVRDRFELPMRVSLPNQERLVGVFRGYGQRSSIEVEAAFMTPGSLATLAAAAEGLNLRQINGIMQRAHEEAHGAAITVAQVTTGIARVHALLNSYA